MAETARKRMTRDYTGARGMREALEPTENRPGLRQALREGLIPGVFALLCAMWSIPGGIAPAGGAALAAVLTAAPALFAAPSRAALFAAGGALAGCLIAGAMPQAVACALIYIAWEMFRRFHVPIDRRTLSMIAAGFVLVCMLLLGQHTLLDLIYAAMTAAATLILTQVFAIVLMMRPGARTLISPEEWICLALTMTAMLCGMQGLSFLSFSPALLGGCAVVIACGAVGGAAAGAGAGVLVGACLALSAVDLRGAAVTLGIAGLMAGAFRSLGRPGFCAAFALGTLVASAVGGMLISWRLYLHVLPACALLLLIPKEWYLRALTRADRSRQAAMLRNTADSGQCARAADRLSACASLFTSLSEAIGEEDAHAAFATRQMDAMAGTLLGLEEELSRGEELLAEDTRMLREALDREGFSAAAADIVLTKEGKEARVSFQACNGRSDCVRAIGGMLSHSTGKRMRARAACAPSDGACSLVFEEIPAYDAITGACCKPAKAPCGDSHLVRPLSGGRFMMAIADGMGSGGAAARESDAALTLLERCLKARIDPATALPMINDILYLKGGEEMYTTLDLCVIDLHAGAADFYKIGAAHSYIRRGGDVMTILSGALPMGILGGVKPVHRRIDLMEGDVIVMASDGISDAARDEGWMREQLRRIDTRNPQATAELLESAAYYEAGDNADDRTALCARIFSRG